MLFTVLAALSGLVWGVADFSGGKASQRADPLRVVWLAKLVSVPLLAAYVGLTGARFDPAALLWGVLAGLFGTVGTVLFYRALAAGAMTVVAPVTSVTSAAIPVVVGLAAGERPPALALGGVLCAVLAVALVSLSASGTSAARLPRPRLLGLAAAAGLGFALFMVCLSAAGRATAGEDGLWPLLTAQAAGLVLGGTFLLVRSGGGLRHGRVWPTGRRLGWVGTAGLLDTAGSATYLLASRHGDLSLVAPVAALYPVTTVLLALLVDRERPRRPQVVGLVLAVAALHLVARPAA